MSHPQIQVVKSLVTLQEDYHDDPVGFVCDIIKAKPTAEQKLILKAMRDKKHVSVRSGHGVGKSSALAWLILWFISTRWKPKIPCTAPTGNQLYDVLWSEIAKWHSQMDPVFKRELEYNQSRLVFKRYPKEGFAVARTARKERPEALSGFHAENLMFVIEEASGVADEIILPVLGSLTNIENYCVMAGNPIRRTGFFYESHHDDRGFWNPLHFNSEDAELVDEGYCRMMAKKFGKESNIYRVRVKGDFATMEADQLINLDWLEAAAIRTGKEYSDGKNVWGLDPARFGSNETSLAKRKGNCFQGMSGLRQKGTMEVVGWVKRQFDDTAEDERPEEIFIDTIGIGAGVADRLRELGLPAIDVEVSRRAENPDKYMNLRAELWFAWADWLKDEKGIIPNDEDLIGQSSTIKYKFDSSGRYVIEGKEELQKRGLTSPDRADAVCLTFAGAGDLIYGM